MAHTKESRRKDEAKATLQIAQKVTRAAIAKSGASKKTGGAQKGEVVNKKCKTSGKAEAPVKISGKAEAPAKISGKAEAPAKISGKAEDMDDEEEEAPVKTSGKAEDMDDEDMDDEEEEAPVKTSGKAKVAAKTSGKAEAPAKTSGKAEAPAKTSGKAKAGAQLDLKDTRPCDRGFYPHHPKLFEKKQLREFTRFDVTNRNEVLVFFEETDLQRKGFYRGLITDLCDSLHPRKLVSTLSPLSRSSSLFLLVVCSSYVRQRFSSSALCVGNCFKRVGGF
jgi:hypothetical protein